jgi:hypothetical protein
MHSLDDGNFKRDASIDDGNGNGKETPPLIMAVTREGNAWKVPSLMLRMHINGGASTGAGNGKGNAIIDDANGKGGASVNVDVVGHGGATIGDGGSGWMPPLTMGQTKEGARVDDGNCWLCQRWRFY